MDKIGGRISKYKIEYLNNPSYVKLRVLPLTFCYVAIGNWGLQFLPTLD